MNIILCYPPRRNYVGFGQDKRWLPLGIASIGAYIKREKQDVNISLIDMFDMDRLKALHELKKYIKKDDINLIGFTCYTEQRYSVWEMCQAIKNYAVNENINIKTIVGGPHAFIMSQQIADNYPYVDYIVRGEGEKAWVNIIDYYQSDSKNEKLDRILESRNIECLDTLPYAIDGFDLFVSPISELEAEAPIVFSRGCTDYCSFCSTTKFWRGYRSRSAENVFGEMLEYNKRYKISKFKFHDDSSTADIDNWKKLCTLMINNNCNWEYEITARADQFDDELIELLSLSGCKTINIGIESGNEALRIAMNKKLDIEKAKLNIKKIQKTGIQVILLFIVGYAGETDETIKDTCDFIKEIKPTGIYCQPLMLFPGTVIYEKCKKWNYIRDEYWLLDKAQPYYTREVNMKTLNRWSQKIHESLRDITVLIAVPVRQKEDIFKLHIQSVDNLNIPKNVIIKRLFVLQNCPHLKKYLKEDDLVYIFNSDYEYKTDENTHYWQDKSLKYITDIKNDIFDFAKNANFDYVFFIDSDLILQPDTLKHLLDANKDIVSEVFWTKWQPELMPMPNAWDYDHYSFYNGTIEKYKQKGVYECGGTGACILIHRSVMEAGVNYNPITNLSFWGEDRAFSIRAVVAGLKLYVDTNCEAFHIYRESYIEEGKKFLYEKCIHNK